MVNLIQIEVVRLEPFKRALKLLAGAGLVADLCLAGEEYLAAIDTLQADAHLGFRVAVAVGRRHIKIVQAPLEGIVKPLGSLLLVVIRKRQARKSDDRNLLPGSAQNASRQALDLFFSGPSAPIFGTKRLFQT